MPKYDLEICETMGCRKMAVGGLMVGDSNAV